MLSCKMIKRGYSESNKCPECGILITNKSFKCRTCAFKVFKLPEKYCVDCNIKIDRRATRCISCRNKNNWLTDKQRKKLSQKHKERLKDSTKHPMFGVHRFGKDAGNWRGGIYPLASNIRKLFVKEWRKKVFKRDDFTCQVCSKRGGNLNADHIEPFGIVYCRFLNEYNQFSPIEDKETLIRLAQKYVAFFDVNNGQTLCKRCHIIKTRNDKLKYKVGDK